MASAVTALKSVIVADCLTFRQASLLRAEDMRVCSLPVFNSNPLSVKVKSLSLV